jgi:DNA-binding transcriptional ArsR family regulator
VSDSGPTDASEEGRSGTLGPHAAAAFAELGHETRLAILLAIWESHDLQSPDNAVAFSQILDRVGTDDPGNVRYHLKKLEGRFVRQRDDRGGYALRVPAKRLVRAVIAGAGVHDEYLDPTEIERPCPFCGAQTVMSYREGVLFWACHACDGMTPGRDFAPFDPPGPLTAHPFDPAAVHEWPVEQLWAASLVVGWRRLRSTFAGVCPSCSSPVDRWLERCPDHDDSGCHECGLRSEVIAHFRCRHCDYHDGTSPTVLALFEPAVVSFYDDHGVSTRIRADDVAHTARVYDLAMAHDVTVVDEDPLRVAVSASAEGESVRVSFDETARVLDVSR